ncbi:MULTISPECIES: spore germination protein [Clostridium]|uniref:spore germination protein n=1 Tax=Clostridium TaxID=1485 RepID=UPI00041DC6C2|nr:MULTISPECIES: spore germination protein [Clostridium]MDB2070536.1 spore germination protein [Clostridium paraputrificum]MDB2082418.1 spore germination protein [Clostridium paraputrificum]MDB2109386.1 spore germination protein [Clostridium paraputrificum]MDB2124191.1 spore germination protein [Clostridium paraputrificum]MDC0801347.1 spore germination protein [Clostridium paraputrificum]
MKKDVEYVKKRFEGAFDVKYREIMTSLGLCTLVFIDDLCSVQFISEYIVTPLGKKDYKCWSVEDVIPNVLGINIANYAKDVEDAILHVLSGDVVLLFNDHEKIIYCEVKGFVRRGVGIPVTESVVKGPREGFTELFVDNVSLIRRKIKNSDLKFEPIYVGNRSQTVVCISYIKGIAPDYLIEHVKEIVNKLDLKFILDTNYIEDALRKKKSVFDTVGYTEKPDEVAAKMLEGRVAILVDGTPFVITVPYFFLENFQAPDDYYLNKYFVNFTRVIRWIAFFLATFMPGLYVAILTHHFALIPSLFVFRLAVSRAGVPLPTIVEVLIMMVAFQLIKEAGLRLPQPIGGAMSIVAGLILGDAVVGAGIASRITIIVVAISTLSYFLTPKLYGAMSIWSLIITVVSSMFGLPGFFIVALVLIAKLADLDTGGYSYLFPLGSVETYKFKDIIFRGDLRHISQHVVEKGGEDNNEKKTS